MDGELERNQTSRVNILPQLSRKGSVLPWVSLGAIGAGHDPRLSHECVDVAVFHIERRNVGTSSLDNFNCGTPCIR